MSKFEENEELNEIYNGEEQFDDIEIITEDEEYENDDIEILTEDEEEMTVGGYQRVGNIIARLYRGQSLTFYVGSYYKSYDLKSRWITQDPGIRVNWSGNNLIVTNLNLKSGKGANAMAWWRDRVNIDKAIAIKVFGR